MTRHRRFGVTDVELGLERGRNGIRVERAIGEKGTGLPLSPKVEAGGAMEAGLPAVAPGAKRRREGGSNSMVESQPSKLLVAGSIPVSR